MVIGRLPGNATASCSCVHACPADGQHAFPSQAPEGLESLPVGTAPAPLPCPALGPPGSRLVRAWPRMGTQSADALGNVQGPVALGFVPTLRSIQLLKLSSKFEKKNSQKYGAGSLELRNGEYPPVFSLSTTAVAQFSSFIQVLEEKNQDKIPWGRFDSPQALSSTAPAACTTIQLPKAPYLTWGEAQRPTSAHVFPFCSPCYRGVMVHQPHALRSRHCKSIFMHVG